MKYLTMVVLGSALFVAVQTEADCIKNQSGNVVCGSGQCETDRYGKVFCAAAGGGAIKDKYGNVQCGVGSCAKDYLEQVWCSKEPGGGAAVDSYGKVKCLGSCTAGSAKMCQEAQ